MWACFLFPFENKYDQNAGTWWSRLLLAHLTTFWRWLQKFCNTDIVSLASPRGILELPSAVFSVCQNCYQKLVFCWHVFWQMHKLQIHKLVSRHDHLNISTMYSVFDWKEFEILSYRQAFWESTEISASEELNALEKAPAQFMALRILSGKGEVQIMLFRKLSGKCHFLLRFCMSNWSETYTIPQWDTKLRRHEQQCKIFMAIER